MIPFVEIDLNGPHKLRFGMAAMYEFEKTTGKKVMELGENMSIETLAELLWIMLRYENGSLTFGETCTMVDDNADNITYVIEKVTEAINAAMSGKNPNAKAPTTKK